MKLLHLHPLILMAVSMMYLSGGVLSAQTIFEPHPDSRLWIEGQSNVNQFTCQANDYRGEARVKPAAFSNASEGTPHNELFSVWVDIKVEGFDCGKRRMNRDLKDALKADEHPHITFVFIRAETIDKAATQNSFVRIDVTGDLTVAGTTRQIQFEIRGEYLGDGKMKAEGSKTIRMTDFNVDPPSGLLGLIKAEDELTVHFDFIAVLKQ